jgi:hypothetical protein
MLPIPEVGAKVASRSEIFEKADVLASNPATF